MKYHRKNKEGEVAVIKRRGTGIPPLPLTTMNVVHGYFQRKIEEK